MRRAALALDRDLLRLAPPSFLNSALGPRRVLVCHRARIDELIRIKRMHDVTVNDVCLAAVTGALRALALSCGEPVRPLKAMVPVSVRTDDERTALGNRISFAFVELPLELGPRRVAPASACTSRPRPSSHRTARRASSH